MSDTDTSSANEQGQGGDAEDHLDEFDLAVSERLAQDSEPPAQAGGKVDDPATDDDKDSEPQPGSEPEARNEQAAGGDEPPAGTPSKDIWENAPPELKAAHTAALSELQTKHTRTIGQLSAADRELARLRRESARSVPASGEDEGGNVNPFETEELQKLEQEYGEVAGPLLKLTKGLYERLGQLEAPVAAAVEEKTVEQRQRQFDIFVEAHPDWESFKTHEAFPDWIKAQPRAVQEAAARAVNLEDGQEAVWLLGMFKASIGVAPGSPKPAPAPSPAPAPAADPRRLRQLAAGRDGGTTTPPVQSGIPDDFDGAVDTILAARERQQSQPTGRFV